MKENSIFIDNFYQQNVAIQLKAEDSGELSKIISGFHPKIEYKIVKEKVVSEIFKALLLHDKLVLRISKILDIINAFGLDDTILLVKTNKLEFIDDNGFTIALGEESYNKFELNQMFYAFSNESTKSTLEWLEKRIYDIIKTNNPLMNVLLLNVEKFIKPIDAELAGNHIMKETEFDIANGNISKFLNLTSTNIKDIKRIDAYNLLRLSNLNKTLIYSSILNIDNISMDGVVKPILGVKLSPRLNYSPHVNLFDSYFEDIFQKKSIPDLAKLYSNKIISLNDYLEIVSTLSSKKFRQWIMEKEYNPIELEKDIIKLNPQISNNALRFIKWSIPNAIGLLFPSISLPVAFADSYIIDKFIGGWHPNFFIDDILKKSIDNKISLYAKEEREVSIKKRFPNIGRNEPCPCGSKLKFKKCCGK